MLDYENVPSGDNVLDDHKGEFFNGFGRFIKEGREYEILLNDNNRPPSPWINVISNKNFGFHISETGAGLTWAVNSRENKITPWSNDPVSDTSSEAIYIKDEATGKIIIPMTLGRKGYGAFRVAHGFGYSIFSHDEDEIQQKLQVFTPLDEPIKLWRLELTNTSANEKYLALTYYVEWVLGVDRDHTNQYVVSAYNNEHEYLYAKNTYDVCFRRQRSYIFSSEVITSYTGDRREFLGLKGSIATPEGLNKKLQCDIGVGYDPCGAIQVSITIKPGETKSVIFGLGQSDNSDEIIELSSKYKDLTKYDCELERVKDHWDRLLGTIKVKTSDRAMDILINGWLLYQTVACRINARSAFYQAGGAYGFRDQLQDSLSLMHTAPNMVKEQILLACSRQFEEGDVQHWWHTPSGLGVRTRITDDLLWLPYVTCAYLRSTGDYSILKEKIHHIKGPILKKNQNELMFSPETSDIESTVYEHCKKTIAYTHFGEHGLPLMGGGDWNDGMNMVGIEGKGESVWLGWFLYAVLGEFIPVSYHEEDLDFAKEQEVSKDNLIQNIEKHAWDGDWYLRAFYDDQKKLGSKESDECKIDSISQSWSVISGGAEKERALKAIDSAQRYLVNEKDWISLLLTPPFDKTENNPGYIKNYYPGVRENGGQYSHASVWLAMAASLLGDYDLSQTLFTMLNPIKITSTRKDALRYEKEPYVMTADIMAVDGSQTGRGGWSWYTGSAGWMYQGLIKNFIGISKEGTSLIINPSVPANFGPYTIWYKYGASKYEIQITSSLEKNQNVKEFIIDDVKIEGNKIELVGDGKYHLVIV